MTMEKQPSRRLFLASSPVALAVFGALGVGAAVPAIDPVFAAIDRHRAAFDAFDRACRAADYVAAAQRGGVVTEAEEENFQATLEVQRVALGEFLATPPITMAGLRAALEYVVEIDTDCVPENGGLIALTLLKSPLFASMSAEEIADV
jgi:hypothetical protein